MRSGTSVATPKMTMRRTLLCVVVPMLFGTSAAHAAGDASAGQKVFVSHSALSKKNNRGASSTLPSSSGSNRGPRGST